MEGSMNITEPGFYNLAAADYHADPIEGGSLSQSRAKVLLDEAGPARFKANHREQKTAWNIGTAAHAYVLGEGLERIVLIDAENYYSKVAKAARDDAYANGMTPIITPEHEQAMAMADALKAHPLAVETLTGQHEVSAFIQRDSLWLRGMLDTYAPGSHIADYKTTFDASSRGVTSSVWKYRYHMQAAWYRSLVKEIAGESLPVRFIFQEKKRPYLVSVWEATDDYLELGRADMDDAIAIYLRCQLSGEWPGYPSEIQQLTPPDWAFDDDIEIED